MKHEPTPPQADGDDDGSIIRLYEARDEAAISLTQRRFGSLCHAVAYNILDNREDAEECVNDAYLAV